MQVIGKLEGEADCQKQLIEALQGELEAAKMAQAQALHKFTLQADSLNQRTSEVSQVKKELADLKAKNSRKSAAAASNELSVFDMDIATMKYQQWKPKMTCGSCTENGNDVEMFLPCGHMLCRRCVDQINRDRARACPFDRRKFTMNEIKPIFWTAE